MLLMRRNCFCCSVVFLGRIYLISVDFPGTLHGILAVLPSLESYSSLDSCIPRGSYLFHLSVGHLVYTIDPLSSALKYYRTSAAKLSDSLDPTYLGGVSL